MTEPSRTRTQGNVATRPRSRWRRLAANSVLSAVALLVLGLILEGVIRLSGAAYDPQYDDRGSGIIVDSPDPDIRKELPPNFEGIMLGGSVRTNSFGIRGPEISLEKPAGVFRIVVLGDSWAFGWGVEEGDQFPIVLERLLREGSAPGEPRYEVLNFSVSAYNTLQQLAVLERKALRFSPDLVMVAYNVNDVEKLDPATRKTAQGRTRALERALTRHSHLIRLIDDRLRRLALKSAFESSGKVDHYRALYASGARPWARVQAALAEIRQLSAEAGAVTYLVHCPWMHILDDRNPYREIHRQVIDASERLGIPSLDLFDTFKGRDPAALRISPLDGHPRAEGHRIAAEAIARDLRRRGLVPGF